MINKNKKPEEAKKEIPKESKKPEAENIDYRDKYLRA